ncbi:MAG: hypothetical protein JO366_05460 [Methylobacteriaceae bacterium]|nr:hypothetical protein [Methylobacteriaceae bacterium]MBV9221081.1 hypothetical protein [Methylobacteriaceae bacterium]MBV9244240.1 hypothetical protein [Methylobacteriaceae bacterium]MBV9637565.1 hypothetical protein [Methylobacteriaceae bacterium]
MRGRICLVTLAVMSALLDAPAGAASPPIECRQARTVVDQDICASPGEVALDREIAALYDRGMAEFTPTDRHTLAQSQLKFLKGRAGCAWATHNSAHPGAALSECVTMKMEERVRALRRIVDKGGYGR